MNYLECLDPASSARYEILNHNEGVVPLCDEAEADKPIAMFVMPSPERLGSGLDKADASAEVDFDLNPNLEKLIDVDKNCPIEGRDGTWEGAHGDSAFVPNPEIVPANPVTNPDHLNWGEILDKYGIEKIDFKGGEPDFSAVSQASVKIDDFSDNRMGKGGNFEQASAIVAKQQGITVEEVQGWMKENRYTWHERCDGSTLDQVPVEIHDNVRHEGWGTDVSAPHNG